MLRPPGGQGQTPPHLAASAEELTRKDRAGDQRRQDACANHGGDDRARNVHFGGLVEEDSKGPDDQKTSDNRKYHTDVIFLQFGCEILLRPGAYIPDQNPPRFAQLLLGTNLSPGDM